MRLDLAILTQIVRFALTDYGHFALTDYGQSVVSANPALKAIAVTRSYANGCI